MRKTGWKFLAFVIAAGLLLATPGCQKKEISSEPGYGTASSGAGAGMGGPGSRKGIGEQDLGSARGREGTAGAAGAAIGAGDRSAFENEDIYFSFDSSSLTPQAQDILRKKAAFLKAHPNVKVTIEGHCDDRGTNEYNLALGEARARAAKAFLTDLGIAASRIATISYGEERPLAKGQGEDAWAKNRRAHFVVEQ